MFGIPCVSIGFGPAARRMGTCLSRTTRWNHSRSGTSGIIE